MGLVNGVYNWSSVKALYFIVLSMNLAGIVALVLAILWAIRFERGFGDYLNLLSPGDGHVWTTVIISAAIFCSPAYYLGVKSWLYLKLEPTRSDLEACLLSGFLVAILNATYLLLLSGFHQKSRDGLIEAIEKYGTDVAVKARVDAVQNELECCGDNSYEDWFRVPWLKMAMEGPEEEEKGPRLEEQPEPENREEESPIPADVPFSCCSNDIPKPCVHHDILNPSAVYDYNPKQLTITTLGCRSKIINRGEIIRTFLARYLALLSVYQMVLSIMSRLLQTAHSNEFYIGPQKSRYYVWIFHKPEDLSQTKDSLISRKKSEPLRKRRSNQRLPSSSSSSESLEAEESEIPIKRYRNRANSMKLLRKIRSKISSVKSKSVPLIKRSVLFSKKRRKERYQSEEEEDEETNQEENRLLAKNLTKSEVIVKQNSRHTGSPSANSVSIDLPPPPPPPPFVTLNLEVEKDRITSSKPSRTGMNINSPLSRSIIKNQNSGRRVKVLEKFGKIWEHSHRGTQRRESGGADDSNDSRSSRSNCSRTHPKLSSTDVYNRFRGTLQHTLARREAIHNRRHYPQNLDIRKSNLLAKLRCNNVPPCYRLLANVEVQKRVLQTYPTPPPPPPILSDTCTKPDLPMTRRTKTLKRRQCSICNRPVQQTSDSSSESLMDHGTRAFSTGCSKGTICEPEEEEKHLREYYMKSSIPPQHR
nr:uncharacterized protein LOC117609974 isoform X2 [Osmia lignaria]